MPAEVLLIEADATDAESTFHAQREVLESARIARAWCGAEALDFPATRGSDASCAFHPTPRLILLDLKLHRLEVLDGPPIIAS
ncbi:MAG: hypothetical protein ABJC74_13455 [Gemmatimonadota bacterium]